MKLKNGLFFCLCIVSVIEATVSAQVIINIQPPPPNRLNIEDLWRVEITNLSSQTFNVYLVGTVAETERGVIFDANTTVFHLHPGINKISMSLISPVQITYTDKKYEDIAIKTGSLPEGTYDYCIKAIDVSTYQEIGYNCLPQIQYVFNYLPPLLILPANGQIVEYEYPMFVVILQNDLPTDVVSDRSSANAENKIVEIIGNQSPLDAIRSNPAWFTYISSQPTFQYPLWARKFENGKRYAWQVILLDQHSNVLTESEITVFEYRHSAGDSAYTASETDSEKEVIEFSNNDLTNNYYTIDDNSLIFLTRKDNLFFIDDTNDNSFPIKFSGRTNLNSQSANRQGTNSELPRNFWRWDLHATLSFYDIPFGFSAFLSSEQKDIKQNINAFQLMLNPREMLETKAKGFISDFFSLFSTFGIGTVYPDYSPLTVSGIPVTGVDIEFTPGIFYSAFTYGRTLKAVQGTEHIQPTYLRKLISAKIGAGKKAGSHLHFTALKSWDDVSSVSPDTFRTAPQENYLLAADTRLTLFDELFSIGGEAAASVITRDTREAKLETEKIPKWVKKIISPRVSTSIDYSYVVNSLLKLPTETKLYFIYKYIGPGYVTHGVPFLRNDQRAYEIKVDQTLLQRSITIGIFLKKNHDNLIPWKKATTSMSAYGINLGLRFRNLPYLVLNYSPYFQENDSKDLSSKIDTRTHLASVMTGYNYKISEINSSTNFFISYQENKTFSGASNFISRNYSLNQSLAFRIPLTIAASASLNKSSGQFLSRQIFSADINGSYYLFEKWMNTLGVSFSDDKSNSSKLGVYFISSYSIGWETTIVLNLDKNIFNDYLMIENKYDEFILRLTITKTW